MLRTSLRLRLGLNLALRRLIAIRLLLNWRGSRRWLSARSCSGGRLIAIWLHILLCIWLTHSVGLLRCVRRWRGRRGARGRSWTRRNHRSDGFALRDWLGHCYNGWLAVIDSSELLAILGGLFAMLNLRGHRRYTLLTRGG